MQNLPTQSQVGLNPSQVGLSPISRHWSKVFRGQPIPFSQIDFIFLKTLIGKIYAANVPTTKNSGYLS